MKVFLGVKRSSQRGKIYGQVYTPLGGTYSQANFGDAFMVEGRGEAGAVFVHKEEDFLTIRKQKNLRISWND